jgi:hypothetical protein
MMQRSNVVVHSRNGVYGISTGIRPSVWLDAREFDHLGPLLGFLSDEFAGVSGRRYKAGPVSPGADRAQPLQPSSD